MSGTPQAVTKDHLQALAARTGDCIADVAKTAAGAIEEVAKTAASAIEEVAGTIPGQMTGATGQDAGTGGTVPAPAAGDQTKFLRGDGAWATPSASGAAFRVSTSDPTENDVMWIKAKSLS